MTRTNGRLIRKIERHEACCDEPAADERPDHERDPGPGRPGPIAAPRSSPLKIAVIIASAGGREERAGDALEARARRSAGPSGASAQSSEVTPKVATPIRKTPPAAEEVAERSADEDQRAEGQQVRVDDPLLERQPAAEVVLDRGQRDVHDRRVDEHDRRPEDAGDEREPVARRPRQVFDTRRDEEADRERLQDRQARRRR